MSSSRLSSAAKHIRRVATPLTATTATATVRVAPITLQPVASLSSCRIVPQVAPITSCRRSLSFWRGSGSDPKEVPKSGATTQPVEEEPPASTTATESKAAPSANATATPTEAAPATDAKAKEAPKDAKAKTNGNGNGNGNGAAKKEEKSAGEIAREKEIAALNEKLKAKDHQLSQLNDQWRAAVAEQENVRRRAQIDIANSKKFGIEGFAKALLEVADTLVMAAQNVEKEIKAGEADPAIRDSPQFQTLRQLYDGVAMMDKVLNKAFERNHVIRYDPLGAKFDPNVHDGIYSFDDPSKPPGTVAAVMKPGYMLHDRVLRAATVATVKGVYQPPASPESTPAAGNGSPSGTQS